MQTGESCLAQQANHSSVVRPSSCVCNSRGDAASGQHHSQRVPGTPAPCAGTNSPAAPTALKSLPRSWEGAEGEDSMDLARRPGLESAQQRLSRATWLHFESGHHRQGGDGIWDVWFVIGWKTQPRLCRTISLTVVSNSCNIWSGGEVAENEVTYSNMPKTWMQGNETMCFIFLGFYL